MPLICINCGGSGKFMCSCELYYCSKKCQIENWDLHASMCSSLTNKILQKYYCKDENIIRHIWRNWQYIINYTKEHSLKVNSAVITHVMSRYGRKKITGVIIHIKEKGLFILLSDLPIDIYSNIYLRKGQYTLYPSDSFDGYDGSFITVKVKPEHYVELNWQDGSIIKKIPITTTI